MRIEIRYKLKNCGTGAGGFQAGNSCGRGEGSGGAASNPAPKEGMQPPKQHRIKLPPKPTKLNIDEATSALREMGYDMVDWKPSAQGTTVTIRDQAGVEAKLPVSDVVNLVYGNSSDPADREKPKVKPRKR